MYLLKPDALNENLRVIICLASQSPRRRQLLEQAGHEVIVRVPAVDDARLLRPNVSPRSWVMSLAYLKARSVILPSPFGRGAGGEGGQEIGVGSEFDHGPDCDLILAADTVCVVDDHILGQPRDAEHAREMLLSMRNRSHTTMTGVCLLTPDGRRRMLAVDSATVVVGNVTDQQIEEYINSHDWRGKAEAYNLQERINTSWPIECLGDPTTEMGLPVRKLPLWVQAFQRPPAHL